MAFVVGQNAVVTPTRLFLGVEDALVESTPHILKNVKMYIKKFGM